MDDAVHESAHHTFDRILLSLFSVSLIGGLITWMQAGFASPWMLRAEKLLLLALVVLILHWLNHFTSASYLLILGLLGLVIELLFQAGSLADFAPYLLIPVIIIASLILSARATVVLAIFSVLALVVITILTRPFSLTALSGVLPPGALLLLTALLATLNRRQLLKLNQRYAENKTLLQQRTLETVNLQEQMKSLQAKLTELEKALTEAKTEAGQTRRQATQKDQQLYNLIRGTVQESKSAVKRLEDVIGGIAEASNGSRTQLFNEAWQKIDHLSSLVTSLEEIICLENEELKLEYQATDIGQLLAELVEAMRGLAREKKLQLRYTPSGSLPSLSADPVRLRQALLQLLGNALKYTDQGVIEVQTEVTERELVIFISDTGVGMSAETLAALFQPQSGPALARRGPGLGLKLAKRLIELHRGRIWANSIKGVGSTFCVALPLHSPQEMLEATHISPARPPRRSAAAAAPAKPAPAVAAKAPVEAARPSQKNTLPPSGPARRNHVGPVARFSPLYIGRFGLILMSLLMAVLGTVICLALVNGPVLPPVTPTVLIQLPASPTTTLAQVSPTRPAAVALEASPTPLPTQTATTAPSPTATTAPTFAANVPAQAERVQPTATAAPLILPSSTRPALATRQPTPTSTSTPTTAPTSTPTATSFPTAAPTQTAQPVTAPPPAAPVNIPFVIEQSARLGLTLIESSAGRLLAQTQAESNGYVSWWGTQALASLAVAGQRDLYLLQPNQPQPVNLSAGPGDDLQPAWSLDGKRIAFSSGRSGNLDIYVMNQSGGPALPLTSSRGYDEWPAWSPDGQRLAFVSDRDGNVEIYLMNSDGSGQQRLTDNPADDWPAAWSPDGHRLVFASNRDGNWNLYVMDSSGANLSRLTNDPGDEREPVWSPDGRVIAFAANGSGNWDIYTLAAPGSVPTETSRSVWTQLTTTPQQERYPAWLP